MAISQQGLPTYSVDQGKPQTELLASCTVCALLLYAKSAITRSSWFHPRPDPSNQNCTITASGAFKPINENCSIVTNQDCILSPLHQIHSSQDLMNLDTSFTSNRAAWGPGWQLPLWKVAFPLSPQRTLSVSATGWHLPGLQSVHMNQVSPFPHILGGNFCLTLLLIYYKGHNLGRAKWKRCIGQGMGRGAELPHPRGHTALPAPSCAHQLQCLGFL